MKKSAKQKLLLRSIFKACGGPTELQELTGIPRQNFTNWQIRGRVPLRSAVKISNLVGIAKWGLNYEEFCDVCEEFPPWEEVVELYFLPKEIKLKLLKGNEKCQKKKDASKIAKKKKKKLSKKKEGSASKKTAVKKKKRL